MSKLPEGRQPLSWQDMPFADRPKAHPSTERLEIEKLQARVAELEAVLDRLQEVLDVDPWKVGFSHWKALRARAESAEAERDALHARVEQLADLLGQWRTLAQHCAISEGVCCCGDDMKTHLEPMMCGHFPVDHGQYIADQLLEETVAALRNEEGDRTP